MWRLLTEVKSTTQLKTRGFEEDWGPWRLLTEVKSTTQLKTRGLEEDWGPWRLLTEVKSTTQLKTRDREEDWGPFHAHLRVWYMLIIDDPIVTMKFRTAIRALSF
jgi:hypothetical protein